MVLVSFAGVIWIDLTSEYCPSSIWVSRSAWASSISTAGAARATSSLTSDIRSTRHGTSYYVIFHVLDVKCLMKLIIMLDNLSGGHYLPSYEPSALREAPSN